jgi:hypothetical protein
VAGPLAAGNLYERSTNANAEPATIGTATLKVLRTLLGIEGVRVPDDHRYTRRQSEKSIKMHEELIDELFRRQP